MTDNLVEGLRTAAYLAFEDGTNDYTTPALAAARIAELEAALKDMAKYIWRDDYQKLEPTTRAALGDKK